MLPDRCGDGRAVDQSVEDCLFSAYVVYFEAWGAVFCSWCSWQGIASWGSPVINSVSEVHDVGRHYLQWMLPYEWRDVPIRVDVEFPEVLFEPICFDGFQFYSTPVEVFRSCQPDWDGWLAVSFQKDVPLMVYREFCDWS